MVGVVASPPAKAQWSREAMSPVRHFRTGLILQNGLLVVLLTLFGSAGTRARRFRLRFLLGGVTLGVGLILLGFALTGQVVAPRDGADGLFCLAFDALDGTLHCLFCCVLAVRHDGSSLSVTNANSVITNELDQLPLGLARIATHPELFGSTTQVGHRP